jgi:pyridoxal phosphate-dependent aminotransferase EpsN
MDRIHLSKPHMGEDEAAFVAQAFESNWMSTVGPHLDAFERELEEVVGLPTVALASGTAAIHLALRLLEVGPGDEVLCPTLTFVATVNPVAYLGGVPVLVDSEATSWNMDPERVEDALRQRRRRPPRALVVVHLYGQSADLDALSDLSARYGVPLVEDAAPAMGTLYHQRHVGGFGEIGTFSFNGNKIITTTGGGALCARDPARVDRARYLATQAKDPGLGYEHSQLGYNYRLSNVLAGIGRGQLRVLESRVEARRRICARYVEAFAGLAGFTVQAEAPWGRHTRWISCFLVDERELGISRDDLVRALGEHAIEARPVWKPMHRQVLYAGAARVGGEVAEQISARGICLPSSSNLTPSEQGRVIEAVHDAVARGRRGG